MGNKQTDSWGTFDPEDSFAGTSLKKRAEKRTVSEVGERHWKVDGDTKLGDAYRHYMVHLPAGEQKYVCECYSHGQGHYRRRKMCSHVLAVILYRKKNKAKVWGDEPVVVEDTYPTLDLYEPKNPEKEAIKSANGAGRRDGAAGQGDGEGSGRFKSAAATTYPDEALSLDDEAFGVTDPFPDKFTEFRPNQWDAIVEVMEHLEAGKKVVMLSAPTGSGKTLIGESIRRLTQGNSVYCCTTKSLQDQIQREFDYARTIKGRSNYPTERRGDLSADDCTQTRTTPCDWCEEMGSCPYRIAKNDAAHAPLPILNIAYYLAETTNALNSDFRNRSLVIIDEADTLEEQLMGSIEVVIGSYLRKSIKVFSLPKKTVANDWVRWLEDEIVPGVRNRQAKLRVDGRTMFGDHVKTQRQIKKLDRLLDRIRPLLKTMDDGKRRIEDGWVMTGYEGKDPTIRFKPIRVDEHARDALWSRGEQFLLMSATLISPAQMAEDLGLEDDEWAVVHLDSTFPVERRPVFATGVASMTNKTKVKAWPVMAEEIEKVIDENPGVRILVHTVSYMLTKYLLENVKSLRTMSYNNAQERERVLAEFLQRDDAVLLAPSFERGIDLPAEDCQVVIIAKVPYPYLGDKQIAARMYGKGGQVWYAVQTIRAIVQMTGRGMRSADDWCDTYIMDSQFKRVYRDHQRLFPKWWRDAVVLSMTDPKNKPMIKAMRERKAGR